MKFIFYILLLSFAFSCTNSKKDKDGEKVLRLSTTAKVKGFDPIQASDLYSGNEIARVYEGLLQYHYLHRPYKLVPNLAQSMPEVSTDGLTYTFKLKKGVLFHDNSCFEKSKGREMKASDVVYSIKRLADPKLQSKGWWLIDGKIAGLNEWRKKSSSESSSDYSTVLEGVKVIDDYTVQFKLTKPFPQFLYALAMPFTYVVPKEAVESYGEEFINNPVGTGPFTTGVYTQGNKIVYTKNPNYRDEFYPSEGETSDKENGLLKDAGKKIPLVDKLIVRVMIEQQPRWLNFLKGKLDSVTIPPEKFTDVIIPGTGLSGDFKKKGIVAKTKVGIDVTYSAFNHQHELFKDNVKLRRAMSLAFDRDKYNKAFFYGLSRSAQSIVPPGVDGYDKNYKGSYQYFDLEKSKKLLKEAGYPEGKKLPEITYYFNAGTKSRQMAEMMKQMMSKIGVKLKLMGVTWPELLKIINTKQAMMFTMAWGADYPDAENFLQLLYSPNEAPGSNASNFKNAAFDELFKKASVMPNTPERTALYNQMKKISSDEVAMIYGFHRVGYGLIHSWLKNFKFTEFSHGMAKYYNLDLEAKNQNIEKL